MNGRTMIDLRLGDAIEEMATLPDSSVHLIVTDPPYHRCKGLDWDRQWKTDGDYLGWIGRLCAEWRRVLRPNGSLYCFASPRMAARVECRIGETFEVLNSIVWNKLHDYESGDQRATAYKARDHASFRRFFDYSERIIFAEHFGSDGHAKGEAGYDAKCDELRGFVFEPLRAYLDGERSRAGVTPEDCNVICGHRREGGMAGRHYFSGSQWCLPTAINYGKLRDATGGFRREYEDLRREYEDLRRPFSVSAEVPYTDVWDFATVPSRPGKHPCAKPADLCSHMVRASSRPGDVVLDCFMGSGAIGKAAHDLGRDFIGIERDPKWFASARDHIRSESAKYPLLTA